MIYDRHPELQNNRGKKIQEVPLYKRTSNNACDTCPFGQAVTDLYEGQPRPPLEEVVVI